jgi:hypothetical protein
MPPRRHKASPRMNLARKPAAAGGQGEPDNLPPGRAAET